MPSWKPLEFNHEYEALVTKKGPHSSEDSLRILEYLRVQKVFQPDVVMLHGSKLLSISSSDAKVSKTYGDEVWALHEQVCIAALHLGMMAWSAHCVEKLLAKFPASKRVKRIYALYREAVGGWDDAVKLYDEILVDAPETLFARKRKIAILKSQGKAELAIQECNKHLELFQTDREVWHELAEIYLELGQLSKAAFCYEDLIMADPRNLYNVLTYAETQYSLGEFEVARKYYCLACDVDEKNIRAMWGMFLSNQQMCRKDIGNLRMGQLSTICIAKLLAIYRQRGSKQKSNASSKYFIQILEDERARLIEAEQQQQQQQE